MGLPRDNDQGRLPRWDMTTIFPSLESTEFEQAFDDLVADVARLRQIFEDYGVGTGKQRVLDDRSVEGFERILAELNSVTEKATTLNAYLYALVTTDATNDLAQTRYSELTTRLVEVSKLETRLTAWIGHLDAATLIERSPSAREHSFFIAKAAEQSRHLMSRDEEDLAATLTLSGTEAWSRLHGNVSALLTAKVSMPDGSTERLPMSRVRALAHDPDASVRKAAYDAELIAWHRVEVPLAAALNGIKGFTNTLNERRSWPSSIEPSLHMNHVDAETLEAMQAAVVEAFPDFRRYLQAKASILGMPSLPWWDIHAPVDAGGGSVRWSYEQAAEFIEGQFGGFSKEMAGLARRAFSESWIDAEPREGKQQGGYCMTIRGDESRVMINFDPSFDAVQTLAHELGHAFHHMVIARRTPIQRKSPMALAETASTFCQAIVFNAALAEASPQDKLPMLESSLQDSCSYIVDIHSRFLFEKAVFEARRSRDLSVDELKKLILDAQRETYGEGLDPHALHPYMWAAKIHYYLPDLSFYNWPYTFGMLFAFGLYNRYMQDRTGFARRYEDLLSSTGVADAAELASGFGIDVRSIEFWRTSLDVCRDRINQFETLAAAAQRAREEGKKA